MNDLERLIAIDEIKQLQARRVRALDTRDWKLYATCHSPNMEHEVGGVRTVGIEKVIDKIAGNLAGCVSIHDVHSPEITFTSDATATAIWVLEDRLIWPHKWVHGYGHYADGYEKQGGKWVFTRRHITRLRLESGKISGSE